MVIYSLRIRNLNVFRADAIELWKRGPQKCAGHREGARRVRTGEFNVSPGGMRLSTRARRGTPAGDQHRTLRHGHRRAAESEKDRLYADICAQKEYSIKPPQISEAHRLSDKVRSGQTDELSAAGHHQAYLARKNAGEKAKTHETQNEHPAAAGDSGIATPVQHTQETVSYGEPTVVKDEFPQGYDNMEYEGDPMYESSVALARRLQEELNRPAPPREEVRAPDSTYQERMLGPEIDDDELQAAIAKSLIDM
ncbi:Ubx5, putative [Babesia ovata]|uniref:Ubx5, putative n=1 Tax=Babesia ovata TaxID=189622 RepID=A0A2H6KEB7_9APIC|nr:Ubx5, putative [Babesia ovata]GBE61341.1 Ubx5, putative [Babesia ovata]